MTLKELIAKNEATRRQKAAEKKVELKANDEFLEEDNVPKKGKKPKKRAYLVKEELPFEEEKTEESEQENTETENVDF